MTRRIENDRTELVRSIVYRTLGRSLCYPAPEGASALATVDLPQILDEAPLLSPLTVPALGMLEGQLRATSSSALLTQYLAAFGNETKSCSLLERDFLSLTSTELAALASFREKVDVVAFPQLPPDHIVSELALMQALSFSEAGAILSHEPSRARSTRSRELAFMENHLGPWAPLFAERLHRCIGSGFYAIVASLVDSFVSADFARLKASA